jgi:hypothetical protein
LGLRWSQTGDGQQGGKTVREAIQAPTPGGGGGWGGTLAFVVVDRLVDERHVDVADRQGHAREGA